MIRAALACLLSGLLLLALGVSGVAGHGPEVGRSLVAIVLALGLIAMVASQVIVVLVDRQRPRVR